MTEACVRIIGLEVREGPGRATTIAGRAAPFNRWSQLIPVEGGRNLRERIAETAFDASLAKNDVLALWQHDTSKPLARVKARSLRLWRDSAGLQFEMTPNLDLSWAQDAVTAVRSQLVDSMSFGFRLKPGGHSVLTGKDGIIERTLTDVDLCEISLVTFPAYPGTEAAVRWLGNISEFDTDGARRRRLQAMTETEIELAVPLLGGARRRRLQTMTETEIQLAARLMVGERG